MFRRVLSGKFYENWFGWFSAGGQKQKLLRYQFFYTLIAFYDKHKETKFSGVHTKLWRC